MRLSLHLIAVLTLLVTLAVPVRADFGLKTGLYTADGAATQAVQAGIQPKFVMLVAETGGREVLVKIDSMAGAECAYVNAGGGAALVTLDADGFTVTNHTTTNDSGVAYYWVAMGGTDVLTGSYTGDGNVTQTVNLPDAGADVEFVMVQPDRAHSQVMSFRSTGNSPNKGYKANWGGEPGVANLIRNFSTGSFEVGDDPVVNTLNNTYHFMAVAAQTIEMSSYTGDGQDDRLIPLPAQPHLVWVKNLGSGGLIWMTPEMPLDAAHVSDNASTLANSLQDIVAGGFQVGSHSYVNANLSTVHYYAWWHGGKRYMLMKKLRLVFPDEIPGH